MTREEIYDKINDCCVCGEASKRNLRIVIRQKPCTRKFYVKNRVY